MISNCKFIALFIISAIFYGCGNYSFTGASIPEGTETFQVNFFENQKSAEIIDFDKKETTFNSNSDKYHFAEEIKEEETLSIHDKELELIKKALERNNGKRKAAAIELGISERTLYRKIKQHDIEL